MLHVLACAAAAFTVRTSPGLYASTGQLASVRMHLQDPFGGDPKKKRDEEVARATGGGWSSILPRRNNLLAVLAIGAVSYFAGDTPLGEALNGPIIAQKPIDQQVDDAGTPYGPTTAAAPTAGLALLVVWNLVGALARRPLEAAAKEKRRSKDSPSENGASETDDGPTDR